jgi:hypothetical protein
MGTHTHTHTDTVRMYVCVCGVCVCVCARARAFVCAFACVYIGWCMLGDNAKHTSKGTIAGHKFSKVLYPVTLSSKYTVALTFEKLSQRMSSRTALQVHTLTSILDSDFI